ncbi:MAG: hypothetical protein ACRC6I_05305 [Paracoccaceae bacterium]
MSPIWIIVAAVVVAGLIYAATRPRGQRARRSGRDDSTAPYIIDNDRRGDDRNDGTSGKDSTPDSGGDSGGDGGGGD